jgi:hypothetical protein
MGLNRWGRKSDENYDAITAGVGGDVDVEIGLPVVNGPNVAGLIGNSIDSGVSPVERLNYFGNTSELIASR